MALTKTITLDNGLVVPDAYIRVETVQGKALLHAAVACYASEAAAKGDAPFQRVNPLYSLTVSVSVDKGPLLDASGNPVVDRYGVPQRDMQYEQAPDPVSVGQPQMLPFPAPPICVEEVAFDPGMAAGEPNFIGQAYAYLLTLDRYAGAVAC